MKKLLSIALCATVFSAFATSTEALLGEVGVTAITSSLSNTIVAVSYDDLAGGSGMVCSNLVKTTNLTPGDSLVEFRDDKYTGWVLVEDEQTKVKYWREQLGAFVDNAGKQLTLVGSSADTVTNTVGTGIWLVRQNPIDTNGNTNSFYIYGKPVSNSKSTTVAGKWTLIGNPKQETVTITEDKVVGASYLDELVVPVDPDGKLCRYQFKEGNGWRTTDANGEWVKDEPPKLGAGLGCWILTQKDASITW